MMYVDHYKRVPIICLSLSIAALLLLVWKPTMPPIAVAAVLSVVAFGIGTSYPVGTVSIQNAVSRYQVGAAMGGMNFFRGLTAVFIVAAMGAIVLAGLGIAVERGGVRVVSTTAPSGDLAHVFRGVFGLGVLCLVVSLIALIRMEERPLRGPSEDVPPVA